VFIIAQFLLFVYTISAFPEKNRQAGIAVAQHAEGFTDLGSAMHYLFFTKTGGIA